MTRDKMTKKKSYPEKEMKILIHAVLKKLSLCFPILLCILSCFPVFLLFIGSISSREELALSLKGIFEEQGQTFFLLLPSFPTLKGYLEVMLDTPEFYVVFWNSVKLTFFIVIGQLLFSVPAAWGFSRWQGKLSSLLFYLYTILMLLPFQVTMLSSYIVIDKLGIMDSHWAIILPAVCSTFPVFLIYRYFIGIPEEIFEAFSMDSSSRFGLFWHMGIPLAMPGIKAALLLGILEYWNLLEQPLLFLKTPALWPFSLSLPNVTPENTQYIFVFSFLVLLPVCVLAFLEKEELQKGIGTMVLKNEEKR